MSTKAEREAWNTDPDAAYAEAERRVEEARKAKSYKLDLSGENTAEKPLPALNRLPSLHDLAHVVHLDLCNTHVERIEEIGRLTNLQILHIDNTQISKIESISNIETLTVFYAGNTQINDITPISNLTKLKHLRIDGSKVSDISSLSKLIALQWLDISNTPVTNITPVKVLENLNNDTEPFIGFQYDNILALEIDPVLKELVELSGEERTEQTLLYLNGQHPVHGGPPPSQDEPVPKPKTTDRKPLVRIVAPSDFKLREVASSTKVDVQLDPVNPKPQQASLTPINEEARATLLAGLHAIAKEIDRSLAAYKIESDALNRVYAARQIAGGARVIARQTSQGGEDFLAPLFHRSVESLAAAWLEDAPALEAYDREMVRGLLEDARKVYPFYPVLAEIDSPTNAELIPDNLASQANVFVDKVAALVASAEGRIVFTDKTREVVEGELIATTPPNVDPQKWKMARFGALVGKMKEKIDDATPAKEDAAAWASISGAVNELWKLVSPFIGL